jgi:hypothetical protein
LHAKKNVESVRNENPQHDLRQNHKNFAAKLRNWQRNWRNAQPAKLTHDR